MRERSKVPWNSLAVTAESLPDCIEILLAEPPERHAFLLYRLARDHAWQAEGTTWSAEVAVMLALVAKIRGRTLQADEPTPRGGLEDFGTHLRQQRRRRHLSQGELAERMGQDRFMSAKLESGEHLPSLDTVSAACRALDCEITHLLPQWPGVYIRRTEKEAGDG